MRLTVRQQGTIDLCNLDIFKRAVRDNEDLGVFVSKENCPVCDIFDEVVARINEEVDTPLVGIDLPEKEDDDPCSKVADYLRVEKTPTFIRFVRGQERGRLVPSGEPERDLEDLRRLLAPG